VRDGSRGRQQTIGSAAHPEAAPPAGVGREIAEAGGPLGLWRGRVYVLRGNDGNGLVGKTRMQRFTGTATKVTPGRQVRSLPRSAERPLLVNGEQGSGKIRSGEEVAAPSPGDLMTLGQKKTSNPHDQSAAGGGLRYDAVSPLLRAGQARDAAVVHDIAKLHRTGKLWEG